MPARIGGCRAMPAAVTSQDGEKNSIFQGEVPLFESKRALALSLCTLRAPGSSTYKFRLKVEMLVDIKQMQYLGGWQACPATGRWRQNHCRSTTDRCGPPHARRSTRGPRARVEPLEHMCSSIRCQSFPET